MTMTRLVSPLPVQVIATSTAEIARWANRLDRLDFALGELPHVARDGGESAYLTAESAEHTCDWPLSVDYEQTILYELSRKITIKHLTTMEMASSRRRRASEIGSLSERAAYISQIAFQDGLTRAGLLETDADTLAQSLPLGAWAALHYRDGGIRDEISRTLYDREAEVRVGIGMIAVEAPTRMLSVYDLADSLIGEVSLYSQLTDMTTGNNFTRDLLQLGSGAHSPFWQELLTDYGKIDRAAALLAVS